MPADGRWDLTLILLRWRIWCAPNNASRWQMGFNSAFEGLNSIYHLLALLGAHHIPHVSRIRVNLILPMWRIGWAPNNASKWKMELNSAFKGLNPICHLLALQRAHHILHVNRIRFNAQCLVYLVCEIIFKMCFQNLVHNNIILIFFALFVVT